MAYRASALTCNTKLWRPAILTDIHAPVNPVTYSPLFVEIRPPVYKWYCQKKGNVEKHVPRECLWDLYVGRQM